MNNTSETTTTTESMWEQRALEAEAKLTSVLSEMEYLKEQIRVLQRKRFGSSSEKTKGITDQMKLFDSMFNEVEATAEPFAPEPDLITVPEQMRKWSVRVAVPQDMSSTRRSPRNSLLYQHRYSSALMYVMCIVVVPARQRGTEVSLLS